MALETVDARLDLEKNIVVESDLDLEPVTSEDEDYASVPVDYRIATYPADFTLEVLHQKWKAGDFIIPDFQRAFVWKPTQSSRLIESFLVGLPVPPVFVYTDPESEKFLIIDGQQRLKSIFYFFEGLLERDVRGNRQEFHLVGLHPESRFAGKTFTELSEADSRRLRNAVLRSFVVQQVDPEDDTSMYHIFERLNTGGTFLANQEIRNCVYHGKLAESLEKLNLNPNWRKILGKPLPDSRKKDIELMVRFFAMRDISGYEKPMKDFLSKFMCKNKNAPDSAFQQSSGVLQETCIALLDSLGQKPFHLRAGLNVATMDSVMVAFSRNLGNIPLNVKARFQSLLEDERFKYCTSRGTTDVNVVRERFSKAHDVLFGSE